MPALDRAWNIAAAIGGFVVLVWEPVNEMVFDRPGRLAFLQRLQQKGTRDTGAGVELVVIAVTNAALATAFTAILFVVSSWKELPWILARRPEPTTEQ